MELEENMYVRTNLGIAKITEYKENKNFDNEFLLDKEIIDTHEDYYSHCLYDYEFYLDQVIKASHNIIDLIEVGDIIKFDITDTDNYAEIQGYNCWEISCEEELNGVKEMIEMESAKLLSIVTKQQFESMAYRIGE